MIKIDWNEYKEYKTYSVKNDKLDVVIDFIKSYYNTSNPLDIYESLVNDALGEMMLEKRDINSPEALESYMFKMR